MVTPREGGVHLALEEPIGRREHATQFLQGRLQLGCQVGVDAIHRLGRVLKGQVEAGQHLGDVGADLVVGQSVELGDDVGELRLEVRDGAGHCRQHRRGLAPVDLATFGGVREEVEGHEELPGDQAPAPQLGPHPSPLDHPLEEGVALLGAPGHGFAGGRLLGVQPRNEALGKGHDLHAPAQPNVALVDVEPDAGDLAHRQAQEGDRRTHGQPAQRFGEIEHVALGDGIRLLHRGGLVRCRG